MPQKKKNVSKPKQPKQNKTTRKPTKPTKKMSNKIMSEAKGNDLNEQFQFPSIKREWQKSATHQKIMGTDYVRIDPFYKIEAQPKQIEFEIKDSEEVWSMGPNSRFKVKGVFQVMTPAGPNPEVPWANCTAAELDKVIVQPNWLETLIKQIEVFHGPAKIDTSYELQNMPAYVNAWKYNFMDPSQKKLLCPQECHPAYGIPSKIGEWDMDNADGEWRKHYGPKIFTGKLIEFDFVPMDTQPFFQGCNYMENPQKIFPTPLLDRISFRFLFKDNYSCIFQKKANNNKLYRFIFSDMYLVVEKLKLNLDAKKSIINKRMFEYPGVTRIMKTEQIGVSDLYHKAQIQGVLLPEGMFIFAVPKKVLSNIYTYDDNVTGNVFLDHNIKSIDIKYGDLAFFTSRPNLGMITNDIIESKLLIDYLTAAPFGLKLDPNKINLNSIKNGAKATPFPHVFVNFCNYKDKSRLVPPLNDGSMMQYPNNLDLSFTFGEGGATADATYIIYYYYTDNNLTINSPPGEHASFTSPYLKLV